MIRRMGIKEKENRLKAVSNFSSFLDLKFDIANSNFLLSGRNVMAFESNIQTQV